MNGKRRATRRLARLTILAVSLAGWAAAAPGCIYVHDRPGYWHHHHGW